MGHLTIGMSHDVVYIFYLEDDQLYGFHTVDQEAPVWALFFKVMVPYHGITPTFFVSFHVALVNLVLHHCSSTSLG